MRRKMVRILLLMVLLAIAASGLHAEGAAKKKADGALKKKDPVEDAFKLPDHLKVEQLSAKQQQAYNQLKEKMTPKLRETLDKVSQAANQKDKDAAAGEVLKLRKEIKADIQKILAQRDPDANNSQPTTKTKPKQAKYNRLRRY